MMAILVKNKDSRLYTIVYPNNGKETIILLHGGPGVPEDLEPIAAFLSQKYQVIYFHQRGTLNSPCSSDNYSMVRYLSDIDSVAAHFNLQKFHLFGHSWGGLYSQVYASQNQNRILSLFLCSPVPGTGWTWVKTALEIRRFNKRRSTRQEWLTMMKNALLGMLGNYKAYQKFYFQLCTNCNKGYGVKSPAPLLLDHLNAKPINCTNLTILTYPNLQKLSNQNIKTTITFGDNDIFGNSTKYIRSKYPHARFITIPNSSHFSWLHNKETFNDVLVDHYEIKTL